MAQNLVKAGHNVTVYDINQKSVQALTAEGKAALNIELIILSLNIPPVYKCMCACVQWCVHACMHACISFDSIMSLC